MLGVLGPAWLRCSFDDSMRAIIKTGAVITVFVAVFAVTWLFYFPHSPWGKQKANLKLADQHRPIVEQRLRQIPGADLVRVAHYTGLGGSLSVSGHVTNEQTAEVLITEVMGTAPPVTVDFNLIVGGTDSVQRIVEPNGAANGSQPVRSETNRTSSTPGSRR